MMKKSFLVLLIFSLIIVCSFASCKKRAADKVQVNEECIYSPGIDFAIVYSDGIDYGVISEIENSIREARGVAPIHTSDPNKYKHSIIIGSFDTEISRKANTRLTRLEKSNVDDVGYVIYTDGKSIALAYDGDICDSGLALTVATDFIIENLFTSDTLISDGGILKEDVFGIIEYQEALDDAAVEKMWDQLLADLTADAGEAEAIAIVNSLKKCYALFNDDVVSWFASLYDPNIGGFYYSNSARDTIGYLPDLESTYQALSFLGGTGLGEDLNVADRIPDWMVKQIISFAKSLQDPESGYFYHPQWGGESFADRRAFIDGTFDSRKGRDLQWGVNLLKNLGSAPTYDSPLGDKGDGILADGSTVQPACKALSERFGKSAVTAVSKVLLVNSESSVPAHLRDVESMKKYLSNLDVKGDSYYVGNLLESQSKQIVARDLVLDKSGRTTPIADVVKAFFDDTQNPETGMWTDGDEITYDGVNGLLKISGVYNGIKKEIPNPIPALNSAMAGITIKDPPTTVCFVLNPWYAITNIIDNVSKYNSSPDKLQVQADIKAVRAEILKNAVELIDVTRDKTSKFVKMDGSFSYFPNSSGPNSQGVPVAVTGSNEGDFNATYMFMSGIPNHIFGILGYEMIPVLTRADRYRLWYYLEDLGEIVKDEQIDPTPVDYEDESVGDLPFGVTSAANSLGASIGVVKTTGKNGKETRALAMTTASGGADTVRIPLDTYAIFYNAVSFEADLKFESNGGSGQIEMITYGSSGDAYRMIFDYSDGGNVTVRTINDFKSTFVAKEGEWFKFRLEYSFADIDYDRNGTKDLLVKIYVNNNHIATGYTPAASNVLKEGNVSGVRFFSWTAAEATLYIDNVLFMQDTVEFDPAPIINEEDNAEKITFEMSTSENIPGKVSKNEVSSSSSVFIKDIGTADAQNKVLGLSSSKGVYDKLKLYVTKPAVDNYNTITFETDISVNSTDAKFELYFASKYSATASKILFTVVDGVIKAKVVDKNGNANGEVMIYDSSSWFTLRVELVSTTRSTETCIYVNNNLLLTSNIAFDNKLNVKNVNSIFLHVKDDSAAEIYLDNIVVEQLLLLSEDESEDSGIDFEDLTLEELSNVIKTDVKEISELKITSDVREGHLTSVLRLNSPKNSADVLSFVLSGADEKSDTVVFETEIKLCDADGDNSFIIYHKTAEGKIANKLIFGYSSSTGSLFAQNEFVGASEKGRDFSQVLLFEGVEDYFKLRIEYSKVSESKIKTKIYINGVEITVAESSTPYSGMAIDSSEIAEVVFETYSSKKLSLCFDNLELYHADLIEDPTEPPELPPIIEDDNGAIFDDESDGSVDNNGWTKNERK